MELQPKVACFIHSATMELHKDSFLYEILNVLKTNKILDRLAYLCINNTGLKLDEDKIEKEYAPAHVIHYSDSTTEFETPTIKLLYAFCKFNPDYKVLYLHTKGVSYSSDHKFLPGVKSWNRYMRHCLLDNFTHCLQLLRIYDTVGCNFMTNSYPPPHYSGNYWWANASYIRNLPIAYMKDKHDPEFWLLQHDPLFFNILSMTEMYQHDHHIDDYRLAVKNGIENNIIFCKVGVQNEIMESQLKCIANTITLASAQCGNKVVILDDFMDEVSSKRKPSCNVLDFPKCNELLAPHCITLIYKNQVHFELQKVEYGLLHVKTTDVTEEVKSRFLRPNCLIIPNKTCFNEFCDDPCPGVFKHIYIHYTLNSVPFYMMYQEHRLSTVASIEIRHNCYDAKKTSEKNTMDSPWMTLTDVKDMQSERDSFLSIVKQCLF